MEPGYTDAARRLNYSGKVLLDLQIDASGSVSHVRILHALGLGLDEHAAGTVLASHYDPASENGLPVPVELYMEVNFEVY